MKLNRFSMLAGALVAGSLALTACGGSSPAPRHAGSSGSSLRRRGFPERHPQRRRLDRPAGRHAGLGHASSRTANPDVTVNYDPVGSGGGREQFLAGGATTFAGSDAALDRRGARQGQDPLRRHRRDGPAGLRQPDRRSPTTCPASTTCSSSADTIAKIFAGKITKWDDAAIKADNPDAKLPSTAITPVHRSDDSGTTQNFTDYLSKAGAELVDLPGRADLAGQGRRGRRGHLRRHRGHQGR